ncbi:thymidine kinase [Aquihabitans sp. McL0605]|uniref:thymidine kinase n=1 Tax=Aquihabitans sp. McL0605 TaxID=3415671 RepID=UPI003CEF1711
MGVLRFSYGTMGSGKSTLALQIHHNLSTRGLRGLLCTHLDREGAQVSSRLGVAASAVDVGPKLDLFALAAQQVEHHGTLHYLVCDEAQFYAPEQADQLARIVDELGADVHALGLLTDFRGRLFPATARLLEVADERCELQVEARCWCGSRATHNARLVDGVQVYDGETVVIGDVEALGDATPAAVSYELLCRRHWIVGETGRLDDATERALSAT